VPNRVGGQLAELGRDLAVPSGGGRRLVLPATISAGSDAALLEVRTALGFEGP
jgi:hypothetical protein